MSIWKTGRQRTLVVEGTFGGTSDYDAELGPPDGFGLCEILTFAGSWVEWSVAFGPFGQVRAKGESFSFELQGSEVPPQMADSVQVGWIVEATTPDFGDFDTADTGFATDLDGADQVWEGSYRFEIPVEEFVELYVPEENSTEIDGTPFRHEDAFAAVPDGLPCLGARFFELARTGENCLAQITLNGITATAQNPCVAPFGIDYRVGLACKVLSGADGWSLGSQSGFIEGEYLGIKVQADRTYTHSGGTVTFVDGVACVVPSQPVGAFGPIVSEGVFVGAPNMNFELECPVRAVGTGPTNGYPDSVIVDFGAGATVPQPLIAAGTASGSISLGKWTVDAGVIGNIYTDLVDEHGPTRSWVNPDSLATAGEDDRDCRLQYQLYPWPALEIVHAASRPIADGTTLTEDGGVPFLATNREGHRYLRIPYAWSGAEKTLTLTIGTKEYALRVEEGGHVAEIDLCLGVLNLPPDFKVDGRDGRWPLKDGPVSDPDESTGDEREDGWLGGDLSRVTAMAVAGIVEGESLTLGDLTLIRKTDAEVGVMLPFQNEQRVWSSETDDTYADYDLNLYADRKQVGPVPFRFHVVPKTGDVPYYDYSSLGDVAGFIAGSLPGWSAAVEAGPEGSPFDPANPTVRLLGAGNAAGNMDPYVWTGTAWRDQTALAPPANLWSCLKVDEIHAYPGCGDPRLEHSPIRYAFPLRCAKVLRGNAEGLCGEDDTAGAKAGISVRLVTWPEEGAAGGATSGADGRYRTGLPGAKGDADYRVRLHRYPAERYEEFAAANRYRERTCFRGTSEPSGRCFLRIHPDLRRALGFVAGGTLWLWFFDVGQHSADLAADARDTGIEADWCAGAWRVRRGMLLLIGGGGTARLYRLDAEGGTPTLSADLGTATSGDIFSTDDVTFRVYRLDGGTLKGHVFDVAGNELAAFDTNLTDLDDAFIAGDQSVARANGVEVALTAVQGGTRKVFLSSDGRLFS